MPIAGEVWRHERFYLDDGGTWRPKYLLILAVAGGDVIYRLLTSQDHSRPTAPACYHGDPYPGFYLGVLGYGLTKDTWLDLREREDMDSYDFMSAVRSGALNRALAISGSLLCDALLCAATAQDTWALQKKRLFATRANLGCK